MEVRCPIHGLIEYNELEERVINAAVVQRLRNIRQLAMAYLVYPGAVHTRFDHSLGVMHIAGRMAKHLRFKHLRFNKDEIQNIRLAALLHDVGHGPFSHVSEIPLSVLSADYARSREIEAEKLHECIAVDVIEHDEDLKRIVGSRKDNIIRLLDRVKYPGRTAQRDIISGPLDADKMDYLLRDSHFCGVKYGVYDLERVLNGTIGIPGSVGESFLGIKQESVWAVEQYLMARYHMTLQVYRHRIRRSTDILLARAILLAAEERIGEIPNLYTYRGPSSDFSNRWLKYDDNAILDAILSSGPDSRARKIIADLRARRLSFSVWSSPPRKLNPFYQRKIAIPEERQKLETDIARACSVDKDRVVVDLIRTDPPQPWSFEPAIRPEEIYVHMGRGQPGTFDEVSDIFKGNPLRGQDTVTVYLPLTGDSKKERKGQRRTLEALVGKVVKERERRGQNGR